MTIKDLNEYILDEYGIAPDHPFPGDETSCAFRHPENRKWFALSMNIPRRRLGVGGDEPVDIVNLKCDPLLLGSMLGAPGIRPAYHMNREHWVTALLDGSASREDVIALVGISFDLTLPRPRRRGRPSSAERDS